MRVRTTTGCVRPAPGSIDDMRAFHLVFASVVVLLGAWMVVYPLSSGRGFTVGALVGLVLIAAGTFRLLRERQSRGLRQP